MDWLDNENYLCGKTKAMDDTSNKPVFGFDLDHTVIKTKSGKTFPVDHNDWGWLYDTVVKTIRGLAKDYNIVIVTNQSQLKNVDLWKQKVEKIINELKIQAMVLVALDKNKYRKPLTGLWDYVIKGDTSKSYYCGDAAGRVDDFSDSDLKWAMNIGINFVTPEQLFLNHPQDWKYTKPLFNKYLSSDDYDLDKHLDFKTQEMIIMVGYPASGKSYVSKLLEAKKYKVINRDILKTPKKCLQIAQEYIINKHSLVIDNTNPDKTSREPYEALANRYKIKVKYFVMDVDYDLAWHNNLYRMIVNEKDHVVPKLVYNIFRKKYEPPVGDGVVNIGLQINKGKVDQRVYLMDLDM